MVVLFDAKVLKEESGGGNWRGLYSLPGWIAAQLIQHSVTARDVTLPGRRTGSGFLLPPTFTALFILCKV